MSQRKLKNLRAGRRSKAATALAVVGVLFASVGLAIGGGAAANAIGPQPATTNDASYWEQAPGELCVKVDDRGATTGGFTITQNPLDGYAFSKIILKKGNDDTQGEENTVIGDNEAVPVKGGTYYHASQSGYSHVILCQVPLLRAIPTGPLPAQPDCDTDGSLTLPVNTATEAWTIVKDGGGDAGSSPYGPGVYDVTVTSQSLPFVGGSMTHTFENLTVLAQTGDCPSRPIPTAPVPARPGCDTDGSLVLPQNDAGLAWSIQQISGTPDGTSPYGPGVYQVTVTSAGLPFPGGLTTHTYPDITVQPATGNCDTTTTTTVNDERKSCVGGVEVRTGTVTTVNGQAQAPRWGNWTFTRGLSNSEFEQLGCRPGQPEPVEILGSETRTDCAGVEERTSTQVTSFVWNETTREYDKVVGETKWSDWAKTRNLTDKELRAEGCVLGEETIVPTPKPDKKPTKAVAEPTVKGVERVAPTAAVPTAVAAGIGAGSPEAMTPLLAQLLVGGGMLLLLAGGWMGLGRREGGAHQA